MLCCATFVPPPRRTTTTTAAATPAAAFQVTAGAFYCMLDLEGCITDGPGGYGTFEACAFRATRAGTLRVTQFETEPDGDAIVIDGASYSGNLSGNAVTPNGLAVEEGTAFGWSSNGERGRYEGWVICLDALGTSTAASKSPRPLKHPEGGRRCPRRCIGEQRYDYFCKDQVR